MTAASDLAQGRARRTRLRRLLLVLLTVLVVVGAILALGQGPLQVSPQRIVAALVHPGTDPLAHTVVNLRLPRVCSALLVGAALGLAGAGMQTVLRNPLADPFTLGLSGGAALGAACAIVLGFGIVGRTATIGSRGAVMSNAFLVGCLATVLVLGLGRLRQGSTETVLLGGVGLSFLFSAGVAMLKYVSTDEQLRDLTMWLMGSFSRSTFGTTQMLALVLAPCLTLMMLSARPLNGLVLGEDVAHGLGIPASAVRMAVIVVATAMTAASVSVSGIIGFVGLVTPHVVRMMTGPDHRILLPGCAVGGAGLMLAADTAARLALSPTELPVGIITSLLGVPVFFVVLLTTRRQSWV